MIRCTERLWGHGSFHPHSCSNKAKYDPDESGNPTKCGVHSAASKSKRKAKSGARHEEWLQHYRRKCQKGDLRAEAITIVRQIAEGHNDPRTLASDWVRRFDEISGDT